MDDDEFFEYIAIPLKENRRCSIQTDHGLCTNEAEWQVVQNTTHGVWRPCCYFHMEATIKQFRSQLAWEQEDINRRMLEKVPTSKLPTTH